MTKTFKIVRGTYLTGLGQEPSAYYFKVSDSDADFETIAPGDVALTFSAAGGTGRQGRSRNAWRHARPGRHPLACAARTGGHSENDALRAHARQCGRVLLWIVA